MCFEYQGIIFHRKKVLNFSQMLWGHSCKIGNAQTLAGIKAKSMLEVF